MRRPLRTVLGRIHSGRKYLVTALVAALLEHGCAIVAGGAIGWLIGTVASGHDDPRPAIVVTVCAVVLSALGNWGLAQFGHAFAFRAQADLRLQLFDALQRSAPREIQGRRTGDLAAVVMEDVDALEGFFAHLGIGASVAVLTGTASVAALAVVNGWLGLIAAIGMLAAGLLPTTLARTGKRRADALRGEVGAVNADVVDGVQGLRELLVFGQAETWNERIAVGTRRLRRYRLAHASATGAQSAVTDGLVTVTVVGVLVTVLSLVTTGRLALPPGLLAVTLVIAALGPVTGAIGMAGTLAPLRASARRVLELLDTDPQVPDTAQSSPEIGPGAVRFEDVSFGYPGRPNVLTEVRFELAPGETVVLVGSSGAGKTTCVSLLTRFWDPDAGRITVDGHDLREFRVADLHRVVTGVSQDVYLFAGSVLDNLRLARPDATGDEIEQAARTAAAHEFITALPSGYDTEIGERGALLSGGQRQRLAIARAVLSDAPILVLDEAASNLDAENERLVQQALQAARVGRTTLVVAHRLSTIRGADRVVVLDGGRVVEQGTHEALRASGGRYAELVARQTDTDLLAAGG